MSVTFSDLPYEVLETIMLKVVKDDPKCFWHASLVNKAIYKVTRDLLSSQKHGPKVAKQLAERGMPGFGGYHLGLSFSSA